MNSCVGHLACAGGLCAVVVTRNRLALLQECVQAIRDQSQSVAKILIIDNGSDEGTQAWLESQKDLWVIRQRNLGSAGGFHRGISEAVKARFEAVWVMDDDVVPHHDALAALHDAAKGLSEYGFLASRVVGLDGRPLNMPALDKRRLENGSPRWPLKAGEGLLGITNATFVSLLIPSRVVHEIGLPIPEMFIWGDDTEYTKRISSSSSCYWVLQSVVVHKRENQSHLSITSETDPKRIKMFFWHYRNNIYVALRYRDLRLLCYLLLLAVNESVRALRTRRPIQKIMTIWRGVIAAPLLDKQLGRPSRKSA